MAIRGRSGDIPKLHGYSFLGICESKIEPVPLLLENFVPDETKNGINGVDQSSVCTFKFLSSQQNFSMPSGNLIGFIQISQ